MKKSLVVLMVVALLAVSAVPALAGKGGPPTPPTPPPAKGGQFTLVGTIAAINGSVVTVKAVSGNPIVKPFIGQNVALQTTSTTRFLRAPAVVITLADLQVGDSVSTQGQLANGLWAASRITVGAKIIHQ